MHRNRRIHRRIAGLTLLALATCIAARLEAAASPVVIDGRFEDWDGIATAIVDPIDTMAVVCDFREIRVTSDAGSLFFYVRLQHPRLLNVTGGSIEILLDADDDPLTGWSEHGMDGVDLVLVRRPGDMNLREDRPVGLRIWPPDAAPPSWSPLDSLVRMGMLRAPAYESDRFEARLRRGVKLSGQSVPALAGTRARVKFLAALDDGTLVDETEPFAFRLEPFTPPVVEEIDTDPLARSPTSQLRVLEWNVSHSTFATRRDEIVRILSALRPDVLLLTEMEDDITVEELGRFLERSGIPEASVPEHVVYGQGGGEERSVVVSRFPLSGLPSLNDLRYPIMDPLEVLGTGAVAAQLDKGISAAGAVVRVGDLRLLVASLGLESKGHRADDLQEKMRRIQAMAIASATAAARSSRSVDAVIIAGDFNLVVTDQPLLTVQQYAGSSVEPLTIVNALQLDGLSNQTWFRPDVPLAPSRLDYLMYSAGSLQLDRSFVFDSRDLTPRWTQHHGLSEDLSVTASDHFPIVVDFSW